MSERPIIFSGESVRAILAGRKTQTRRVVRLARRCSDERAELAALGSWHQDGGGNWIGWTGTGADLAEFTKEVYPDAEGIPCPLGKPGDLLWVRETWLEFDRDHWESPSLPKDVLSSRYGAPRRNACAYRADTTPEGEEVRADYGYRWRSPIFMPRWASRLTLRVTAVRVQRIQEITDEDARAEGQGITWGAGCFHRSFSGGWDALNAKRGFSWASNPWVWAVAFEVCA